MGRKRALLPGRRSIVPGVSTRHALGRGLLFSLAFLKPKLAVPSLDLLSLVLVPKPWHFLAGVTARVALLLGASILAVGIDVMTEWVRKVLSVAGNVASQPNIAPLIGIYANWVNPAVRVAIGGSPAVLALTLTALWW
jgi:hypothetical protein